MLVASWPAWQIPGSNVASCRTKHFPLLTIWRSYTNSSVAWVKHDNINSNSSEFIILFSSNLNKNSVCTEAVSLPFAKGLARVEGEIFSCFCWHWNKLNELFLKLFHSYWWFRIELCSWYSSKINISLNIHICDKATKMILKKVCKGWLYGRADELDYIRLYSCT